MNDRLLLIVYRSLFGIKEKDRPKIHGTLFTPIPVRIVAYDEEKVVVLCLISFVC